MTAAMWDWWGPKWAAYLDPSLAEPKAGLWGELSAVLRVDPTAAKRADLRASQWADQSDSSESDTV